MESTEFSVYSQYSNPKFQGGINAVDVENNQKRLVFGCTENAYCFCFDTLKNQDLYCFTYKNPNILTDISIYQADCSKYCTAGADGKLRVHMTKHPSQKPQIFECNTVIFSCSYNSYDPIIAAALDGKVRLFDERQEHNLATLATGYENIVSCAKWVPNSNYMVVAGDEQGHLMMFDIRNVMEKFELDWYRNETLEDIQKPQAHNSAIVALSFCEESRTFISCDQLGTIREWDYDTGLATFNEYHVKEFTRKKRKYEVSLDSKHIIVPENNSLHNIENDEIFVAHSQNVNGSKFFANGFVSYGEDSVLTIWSPRSSIEVIDDKSDWSD